MPKRKHSFQTIRTEGAILPPDLLQRVAGLEVDGVRPSDYHLPEGLKLNEEISRAWNRLQAYWKAFADDRERIPESDNTGGVTTRDKWLLPLFQELGYGRLTTTKAPDIDGRSYPIERFYSHVPLHLIGCKLPLDKRTPGARGAATASPHSLVQEFLNRSDDHLWAFLSNGLQLRILRDNYSLSRQSYVEFDLEAMMDGEIYADFALLWLICHQSRVEANKPEECWLEKWSKLAHEQGTRVLNELRDGVQKSIEALGIGFLAHKANSHLRKKLKSGDLPTQDYYRQLLRIVYRLLFLFVAEDRELLHPRPDEDAAEDERQRREIACTTYDEHYSLRRLRDLAERVRGSKHADLWHTLSLVFDALSRPEGLPQLALPGLGSFLWNPDATADLLGPIPDPPLGRPEPVYIANHHLMDAVRALAFTVQNRSLRAVDYKNLGSEELGSVYESLLELVPEVNADGRSFALRTAAGSERKTTGSYYTPDSLVQCLLDSALEPVVADRLKPCKTDAERIEAILSIKVCDPAVGSGHFLIAAAHRLARHLARILSGESEPTPDIYQHALRDVIRRCVYGVDLNPMAAELCKVALWMESIEPGKPLTFLDAHIQVGNSLLGTTPRLLAEGIPDDAFSPIEGDVKTVVSELKKQNKKEQKDKKSAMDYLFEPTIKLGNLPAEWVKISDAADDSVAAVAAKERRYAELVSGSDYQNARLLADTWCAAFVWKKEKSDLGQNCPTEHEFRRIETTPHSILPDVKAEVRRLAEEYQFFHWHLAFPDVFRLPDEAGKAENEQTGCNAGFDVVLGNPPWEKVQPEERQFFISTRPDIAQATGGKRKKLIRDLKTKDERLWNSWNDYKISFDRFSHLIRAGGRYPLSAVGNLNTSTLFLDLSTSTIAAYGQMGLVVPSGIATNDITSDFFQSFVKKQRIRCLYDFENGQNLFPAVHSSYRFCLLVIGGLQRQTEAADFSFFRRSVAELTEEEAHFSLSPCDFQLLSPNTGTCPTFQNRRDAEILKHVYRRVPPFIREKPSESNPWHTRIYAEMYNMTRASHLFHSVDSLHDKGMKENGPLLAVDNHTYFPVYEARMLGHYDHRLCSVGVNPKNVFRGAVSETTSPQDHSDPYHFASPRYWMSFTDFKNDVLDDYTKNWFSGFRMVTAATNERTMIASIFPRTPFVNTISGLFHDFSGRESTCLIGNLSSFVLDYAARQRISGVSLNFFVAKQLPILPPDLFPAANFLTQDFFYTRVLELTYTAWDLEGFALDCDYDGPPFRWDEERRFLLRCELDAAYFHLYLGSPEDWGKDNPQLREMFPTPRDAVDYIMDTFPIVKTKDIKRTQVKNDAGEITTEGTYITKDTILDIYDQMQTAIHTGQPYQTRLNPPPGPPADAEGNFIPMAQWDPSKWPVHIHPPKEGA